MGYRKISHYLNEKNIFTERGNRWGSNYVYSVLKRYKERQSRIRNIINKKYEPEISNLWLEYKWYDKFFIWNTYLSYSVYYLPQSVCINKPKNIIDI